MEEIDIIELLQRVKEGKAPQEIEIEGFKFYYNDNYNDLCEIYESAYCYWSIQFSKKLDTKIKILDKPIIEELDIKLDDTWAHNLYMLEIKINEIIKHINKEEK